MPRTKFTLAEQKLLLESPHVLRVSDTNITFAPEFKVRAVRRDQDGLSPQSIFADAGIPVAILGDRPKVLIGDWRDIFASRGEDGLLHTLRGKSTKGGRPKKERLDPSKMTLEEQVEYYKTRSLYFEAVDDFFRKAQGLPKREFPYGPNKNTL